MAQYTNEQILENYKKLPKELQNAITSVNTTGVIQALGKKYNLPIDKMGQLDDEVGLLMLGITHPKDFVANLAKRLGTDPAITKEIAGELNAQIFSKVKDSLKKIHGVENEEQENRNQNIESRTSEPAIEVKKSPFAEKLEEKVFKPTPPAIVKEVEEARKENRYPTSADPYREPPK